MTAAPLIAVDGAPVPPGAEAAWFKGSDGAQLRAALFPARGALRGSVVLSGGRTEPIEKYFEVIGDLTRRGYVVLAHDWRGQGLSHRELPDRLAGHARGYDAFLTDYRALLAEYEARLPKPWFALGHSMGGCLTLLALAHGEARRFEGAILSAPMLGLQIGGLPPLVARALVGFNLLVGRAGAYVRAAGAPETFETNVLTHDRARYERSRAQVETHPDLGLGGPTWGWLDFAFKATSYLARPENLEAVTIPVVIVSAARDRLVDNNAQRVAAKNLPKGEFISVPGAFHEILMETDNMRNIFLRALDALLGKSAPAAAAKPAEAAPPAAAAPAPAPKPEPKPEPAVAEAAAAVAAAPPAKKAPAKKAAAPKPAAPAAAAKPAAKKTAAAPSAAKKSAEAPKATAKKVTKAPAEAVPTTAKKPAAKTTAKPAAKAQATKAPAKAPAKAAAAKPAAKGASKAPAKTAKPAATPAAAKSAAKKPASKPAAK